MTGMEPDDLEFGEIAEELRTITMPSLTVHVDFVQLYHDVGRDKAIQMVIDLRDLLQ